LSADFEGEISLRKTAAIRFLLPARNRWSVRFTRADLYRPLMDHPRCGPTRTWTSIQILLPASPLLISSFSTQLQKPDCSGQLPVGVCFLHVKMESLSDTLWDVVISGTGLQQSLLAL
jgi:hypothetical protein